MSNLMTIGSEAMLSELIDILACPVCKEKFTPAEDNSSLLCLHCGLQYPVRDGIPVLLRDEAIPISNR